MVVLIGICVCVRRQQPSQMSKSPNSILSSEAREGSIRSGSSEEETDRIASGNLNISGNVARYSATTSSGPVARDYGPMRGSNSMPNNIFSQIDGATAVSGVPNPGYTSNPVPSYHDCDTESMAMSLTLSAEEVYSQASNTMKRKSRMRNESAAAIAVMRTTGIRGLGLQADDKDSLIENDSVVVYTERTAL